MRNLVPLAVGAALFASLLACGNGGPSTGTSSSGGSGGGCHACTSGEICTNYVNGAKTTIACTPLPMECAGEASCDDNLCVAALYRACRKEWAGAGCSDTVPPAVLSCIPSN